MKEKLVWKLDGKVIGEVTPCDMPMAKSHYKVEFSLDKRLLTTIPLEKLIELHVKDACRSIVNKLTIDELKEIFNIQVTNRDTEEFRSKCYDINTSDSERAFLNEVAINDVIHFLITTK